MSPPRGAPLGLAERQVAALEQLVFNTDQINSELEIIRHELIRVARALEHSQGRILDPPWGGDPAEDQG